MTRMIGRMAIRAAVTTVLLGTASAAMAQNGSAPNYGCATGAAVGTTCINGGGSSLAAGVYAAPAGGTFPNGGELTQYVSPMAGSIGFSYEKASSGGGQSAFALNDPSQFNGTNESFTVHYAASDAYIDSASVLFPNVGAGHPLAHGGGQFIQIPMFATPITVPVKNAKMLKNNSATLTDNDLCGIFSGKITNWNATSAKLKLTAGTIHVYWRNDNKGSGTTFLFTQHLAAVCTSANTLSGFTFSATTKFAKLFNGVHGVTVATPPNDGSTVWVIPTAADGSFANLVGATGSSAIAAGILGDSGTATGYLSPDYTAIATTPAAPADAHLYVVSLLNAQNNVAYLPSTANTSIAINHVGPGAVNPNPPVGLAASAIQTNWVPEIFSPSSGYPIVGYTNWLVAQCYANTVVSKSIIGFLTKHLAGTYKAVLASSGFVPVLGSSTTGWGGAINKTFVGNASGLNLNIENVTACKSVTKR